VKPMKTIRWGIIGVGDVTEVKSGPGFQEAQHSELVAVMRRSGKLVQDYASRHGVKRWYDDAGALIADPEVDAVYIAAPPYVHKDYTLMCAQAGKPVLVEKPMALNFAECEMMVNACQSAGVHMWVAFYRRALPRFLKIKDLVDTGAIGKVNSVAIRLYMPPPSPGDEPAWKFTPSLSGGGKFIDMGVHTLDFLDFVFGPIQMAQGLAGRQGKLYEAEDHVVASFRFESGILGTGDWYFTSREYVDETRLIGTDGEIAFSTFDTTPIKLTTTSGSQFLAIENPAHVHQPLIQTIVNELNGQGQCPSTGVSGARTTWITDHILQHRQD
jgi:predicted dehydrogenase